MNQNPPSRVQALLSPRRNLHLLVRQRANLVARLLDAAVSWDETSTPGIAISTETGQRTTLTRRGAGSPMRWAWTRLESAQTERI